MNNSLKIFEIVGFCYGYFNPEKDIFSEIYEFEIYGNEFYKKHFHKDIILKNICLDFFKESNQKNDLKIINNSYNGKSFKSENIFKSISKILKSTKFELNNKIFCGDNLDIYFQKISFIKGSYLRHGFKNEFYFAGWNHNITKFVFNTLKEISENPDKIIYIPPDSEKEGGSHAIVMNDNGKILEKIYEI